MNKSKIFFILSLSFIGGIFFASFYFPRILGENYLFVILILSLIFLVSFYKNKKVYFFVFIILFFLGGIWLTNLKLQKIPSQDSGSKDFSGFVSVVKEPETKDRLQKIVAETSDVSNAPAALGHSMSKYRFLITTNSYPQYAYGDKLKVDCKLEIPQNQDGFDYRMYLAKDDVFYVCKNPKVGSVEHGSGSAYGFLLEIKNQLEGKITQLLPAPESGLMIGLILGGTGNLSKGVQDNFSKTGLTHIVAVSGYNVTIVAEYLMLVGIFLGLWRKQAFYFAILGIFLFVVMTGMSASAVRAGVMGWLILWAMKNGRLANSQNAIIFAAGVMLLFNPLLLRWDVGFQLSFLATLGIIYFYPLVEKYSIKKQGISFLSEILFLSLSAQVFVLPIILNDFGQLSLISPLANILILPILPLTMLLGFIMVVLAFLIPPLGTVLAWLTFLPLKYETGVINFLAGLKYSAVQIPNFSWEWVVIWYIILAVVLFRKNSLRHWMSK